MRGFEQSSGIGKIFDAELPPIVDDLTPYEGQWIAVREGKVIASNADPTRLFENPDVEPGDELMSVSPNRIRL